ncbi:MAG: NADH:flavin oxidoreductase [Deltaproteobacteria bacterium]|nr:NADH:flavin oxidoreductase [Deltaproteobacteria bacterium]
MFEIFEPVEVATLTLRNRIVRSATWLGLAGRGGEVTDALVSRYEELGAGGAGLVIGEYTFVSREGRHRPGMTGAHEDDRISDLTRWASAIKRGGAAAALQLVHAGGQTRSEWIGDTIPVAPSLAISPQYSETPRELYREEITRILKAFGQAARRAREAGFDAVQIHAAHGFLVNQFLSPLTNLRGDRYGGDLRGRFRFLQEVVVSIQLAAGADFPVLVKLNGSDFLPGGFDLGEACDVAEWLSQRGVAMIEVSGGTPGSGPLKPVRRGVAPGQGEAYFRDQVGAIKRRVACPVALVGGLRSLETLEELLAFGEADLFSLSRPLLCEPDLPRRWQSGDRAPSRCVACNRCFESARSGLGAACGNEEARSRP